MVFLVINNQFGMGTALERHSAVTDLARKSGGFGVPGSQCDGMDVLDVHAATSAALAKARDDREPQLVEAVTYRFRGHSMADPEDYREKAEVEEWRRRDPITVFERRLAEEGIVSEEEREQLDASAREAVDDAVKFADESPLPELDSLYDDLYVYGDQLEDRPMRLVDGGRALPRDPPRRGRARVRGAGARARGGRRSLRGRRRRARRGDGVRQQEEEQDEGEGEPGAHDREAEGGGD